MSARYHRGTRMVRRKKYRDNFFSVPTRFLKILKTWISAHSICSPLREWMNQTGIEPDKRPLLLSCVLVWTDGGIFEIYLQFDFLRFFTCALDRLDPSSKRTFPIHSLCFMNIPHSHGTKINNMVVQCTIAQIFVLCSNQIDELQ